MSHTRLQFPTFFSGRARIRLTSRRGSAGYAAIALMAVLGIIAATVMVTSLNASALRNDQDRKTTYALAQAKQALIGRAASELGRPGSLPCPDVNNDGLSNFSDYTGSACTSYVGRLPWKALGLPDLRDADGERLWYAISPNFREIGTVVVNSDTVGTLGVTGTMTVAEAAAIIFSAGAPVDGQNRSVANSNTPAHYLDGPNSAATAAFQALAISSEFNDRLMPVVATELLATVQKRVGKEIASTLDAYYADATVGARLPYPANPLSCVASNPSTCASDSSVLSGRIPAVPTVVTTEYMNSILGPNANWFNNNGWRELITYAVSADCVASSGCKSGAGGFKVAPSAGGAPVDGNKVTLTYTAGGGGTTSLLPQALQ